MNKPITSTEIEAVIKNLLPNQKLRNRWLHWLILQNIQNLIPVLLNLSQNTEEEGNFPNTFYKAGSTLTPKSDMDTTHKKKVINKASLMNIGCIKAKILNNISANGI